jgi:hypothetical protein
LWSSKPVRVVLSVSKMSITDLAALAAGIVRMLPAMFPPPGRRPSGSPIRARSLSEVTEPSRRGRLHVNADDF